MRIGFDVSQTGPLRAGCGYVADGLIRHLAAIDHENEYVLYPVFGDAFWDYRWKATCRIKRPNFRMRSPYRSLVSARRFWAGLDDALEKHLGNPDIVHSNNFFCPTRMKSARIVYTLHDLSFLDYPEWATAANWSNCFTGVLNASTHASLVMAVSEYSRSSFLATFPHFPRERTVVVHPASRFSGSRTPTRPQRLSAIEPGRYWFTVSTLEPRKNHLRLLEALVRLNAGNPEPLPLVIAGGRGWLTEDIGKSASSMGLGASVRPLGYVDDLELEWLYRNCFAFVYPSLFEGFGMPVLEAMSLGAPVISSRAAALTEIAGNAALLFDPNDSAAICRALRCVLTGEVSRDALREQGFERAREFSWQSSARRVLDLYREVLALPGAQPA